MNVKNVKNATDQPATYCGMEIQPAAYYQIQECEEKRWASSSLVMAAVATGALVVNDGVADITDVNAAIDWLKNNVVGMVEVSNIDPILMQSTTPLNNHTVQPMGRFGACFDSSDHCSGVSLEYVSGTTFRYGSGLTPVAGGYIVQDCAMVVAEILEVEGDTIVVQDCGVVSGTAILSHPINMDYELPNGATDNLWRLWGIVFACSGHAAMDIAKIEIVDTYGVFTGVPGYVMKEYDDNWVELMDRLRKMMTPDGSPGEIPITSTIRIKLLPTERGHNVMVWGKHIITNKDS